MILKTESSIQSDHEVIKLFSCSTQRSTNFQLLIKTKIPTNKEKFCLSDVVFIMLITLINANNCWYFNIYEQDAQLI